MLSPRNGRRDADEWDRMRKDAWTHLRLCVPGRIIDFSNRLPPDEFVNEVVTFFDELSYW